MPLATWQKALDAAVRAADGDPTARFAQLATVSSTGTPRNRTVVVRGVTSEDALLIATDARSQKVAELQQQPWAALCWYFQAARRQFRFRGRTALVDAQRELRADQWASLSERVRAQFSWPSPGAARAPEAAFEGPPPLEPPAHFVLLVLRPTFVDFLDISVTPHRRIHHRRDAAGRWQALAVNP
jgi:PPOX class probable FMN-dependent enzyme